MCRNLEGTSTVRGSVLGWSWRTMISYIPLRWSASFSLNVFLRVWNEDGMSICTLSDISQNLAHTSTRSRISACSAACSSSWQSQASTISGLVSDIFSMSLDLRSKSVRQFRWYFPSAAVRSFTQARRTLRNWSYCAASSILLLTLISCMRWSDAFFFCRQKMHWFQSICGVFAP